MRRLLVRLAADRSGNTAVIIAAALLPLLAMVGGAVDASRGYMAQARLQQACDAGVLAARKQLGSQAVTTIPADAKQRGDRFFDVNFPDKSYGTRNRSFVMSLTTDRSIDGVASVVVPTTIMGLFNHSQLPLTVNCEARLNFANVDVMMVLDTTGSMLDTNVGDTQNKLDTMRGVIRSFHTKLEAQKGPGTRTRYGFVPYSANVNVGNLLKSDWLADRWTYRYRLPEFTGAVQTSTERTYAWVSGSVTTAAPYRSLLCPLLQTYAKVRTSSVVNGDGSTTNTYRETGTRYLCQASDGLGVDVTAKTYNTHIFTETIRTSSKPIFKWNYRNYTDDVQFLQSSNGNAPPVGGTITRKFGFWNREPVDDSSTWNGCIQERTTYQIDDYNNVDLSRAIDLDIDRVPGGDDSTKWGPFFDKLGFVRGVEYTGGLPSVPEILGTDKDYVNAAWWNSTYAVCPSPARNLAPMTSGEIDAYLNSLHAIGGTYHDIGMIWGARLLSPSGLFAAQNANVDGRQTSRHIIFLTDGQTSTLDITNTAYGVEGINHRRWSTSSPYTLDQTVEKRFAFTCSEAKKRNMTIWVVAFGTTLNSTMMECAGAGHYFEAKDSAQLESSFDAILRSMGDLRISR